MSEKKLIYSNENDFINKIKNIISGTTKKKSKDLLKTILSEKKFFPSELLVNELVIITSQLNDNEIGIIYFELYNRLLKKHDVLGEKLKEKISLLIKDKLGIQNEIQNIFDNNNVQELKRIVENTLAHTENHNNPKETSSNLKSLPQHSNFIFLLAILLYQYNRSIYFESLIWNFIKLIIRNNKNKELVKNKAVSKELYSKVYSILQNKNGLKQIKKYYLTISPLFENYHNLNAEIQQKEDKLFIEIQQNKEGTAEINKMQGNINSLNEQIFNLQNQLRDKQQELITLLDESNSSIENQRARSKELISMEKKSVYNNIKKDVLFCFNEIKLGLSRGTENLTKSNIELLVNRIDKTEAYIQEMGEKL